MTREAMHGGIERLAGFERRLRRRVLACGRDRGPRTAIIIAGLVLGIAAIGTWLILPSEKGPGAGNVVAGVAPPPAQSSSESSFGGGTAPDKIAQTPLSPGAGLNVPATTPEAFAGIPPPRSIEPLAAEADPALLEAGPDGGRLPRIADDGRMAWQVYARPFDRGDERPRVAVVIDGLGLSAAATEAAIQRLPGAVTLAFDALAEAKAELVSEARRFGHETLATLPLETREFPFEDRGPGALQAGAPAADNIDRLERVLAAAPASVGVLVIGGSRFARSPESVQPVLRVLKARGVLLVDGTGEGSALLAPLAGALEVPRVYVDRRIDDPAVAGAIDGRLAELERLAKQRLVAVGLGRPSPLTLARVRAWSAGLNSRGLVLAPVTAVAGTQFRTP